KQKRIIAMDIGAMVAGAKFRGEFEDRLKAFLKEVTDSQGQLSCSSTNCTQSLARAQQKVPWTLRTCLSRCLRVASYERSARPRSMNTANTLRKTLRSSGVFSRCW